MELAPELVSTGFCPFAQITGKPCVLCGGSRALVSLLQGDIGRAIEMNSPLVLFIAVFVFYIFFETAMGKFRTLGNLVSPRELVARSGRVIATHPRGVAVFGLVWWLWNIQRWG